ncbi:MAG: hypothetical protein ACT4QE_18595, partial [Anaerolineales bacterium]
LELADEQTTPIMCSEEDPAQGHRHHLIAKYLMQQHPDVTVVHVRRNGDSFKAASLRLTVDEAPAEQMPLI